MSTRQKETYICLFELTDKDQAVIQRVISFAATQGKPYVLSPSLETSAMVIYDNSCIPTSANQAVRICIGNNDGTGHDLALQRPLLVTRVMRVLDDALQLLQSRLTTRSTPPKAETDTDKTHETTNDEDKAGATAKSQEPDNTIASDYTYTALVVDDSAAIRKQLEIELRSAGIRAEFAKTGEEALEKSNGKQYDLVFLDIIMPGIDGYEVCRQMRTRKNMKKTPVIMLSGKTSPLDEVQGVIAGASTYLTKPVKQAQFQQTLTRVSKWLSNFAK